MTQLTHAFFGREDEIAHLCAAQRAGLISIIGPPGAGKTSLAREVVARDPREGSAFVDLSEARSRDDLLQRTADALGVELEDRDADEAHAIIESALRERPGAWIVLDNLEQLLEHATPALARWLDAAPRALFLVTSRAPTELPEELRLDLGPLALPPLEASPERCAESDAVRLFLDRAALRRPRFEPDDEDLLHIAALTHELDGLPLAIELAAGRIGLASPRQLLARIRDRFALLKQRTPDVTPRHATMLAAIAWSWELLSPHEQSALAQCSVFRGGFDLDAAEACIVFPMRDAPAVIDALHALQDHSLITLTHTGHPVRLTTYLSIRDFAWAQLDNPRARLELIRRHADWYARQGRAWSLASGDADGAVARQRLRDERENIRAVTDRLQQLWRERPDDIQSVDVECWSLSLRVLQYRPTHREQLLELYEAADDAVHAARSLGPRGDESQLDALRARAGIESRLDERAASFRTFEELLHVAERVGEPGQVSDALIGLANRYRVAGEVEKSRRAYERALEIERSLGRDDDIGLVIMNIGVLDNDCDRLTDAAARFDEAIELFERGQKSYLLVYALANRAGVLAAHGATDAALDMMERCIQLQKRSGDAGVRLRLHAVFHSVRVHAGPITAESRRLLEGDLRADIAAASERGELQNGAYLQAALGDALIDPGRLDEARAHHTQALRLNRDANHEQMLDATSQLSIGLTYWEEGDRLSAREPIQAALAIWQRSGSARHLALTNAILSAIAAQDGDVEAARRHARDATFPDHAHPDDTFTHAARLYAHLLALEREEDEARVRADVLHALTPSLRQVGARTTRREPIFTSLYIRHAMRVLDRALPQGWRRRAWGEALDAAGEHLLIDDEEGYLRPPARDWFDLARRPQLHRFFLCLLDERTREPGHSLDPADLIERAWPDEQILYEAGLNRVYKAVSTLRKLGLRGVLEREADGGYRLDPGVAVLHLPARGQLIAPGHTRAA